MDRLLLKWILLLSFGILGTSCVQIDPEVRVLLSASKPPPTDGGTVDPSLVSSVEIVQGTSPGYGISSGGHGYRSRLEVVQDGSLGVEKSSARDYLVVWDLQSGEELKSEGVFDNPSGFDP